MTKKEAFMAEIKKNILVGDFENRTDATSRLLQSTIVRIENASQQWWDTVGNDATCALQVIRDVAMGKPYAVKDI